MVYIDYHIKQEGKSLSCTDELGKIVINKFDNKISRIVFEFDNSISGRLYFVMLNPETKLYSFFPIVDNMITITTEISAIPGVWNSLLIGVQDDYEIVDGDIDQSKTTFVSNEFKRIVVRDNFLSEYESDVEEVKNPEIDKLLDKMIAATEEAERIVEAIDADIVEELKDFAASITTDGDGTKFLADDGKYYKIDIASENVEIDEEELNNMLEEVLANESN